MVALIQNFVHQQQFCLRGKAAAHWRVWRSVTLTLRNKTIGMSHRKESWRAAHIKQGAYMMSTLNDVGSILNSTCSQKGIGHKHDGAGERAFVQK